MALLTFMRIDDDRFGCHPSSLVSIGRFSIGPNNMTTEIRCRPSLRQGYPVMQSAASKVMPPTGSH